MKRSFARITFMSMFVLALFQVIMTNAHAFNVTPTNRQSIPGVGGYTLDYVITDWSLSDPTPGPCIRSRLCYFAVVVLAEPGSYIRGGSKTIFALSSMNEFTPTMGEIRRLAQARNGFSIPYKNTLTVTSSQAANLGRNACVGITVMTEGSSQFDTFGSCTPINAIPEQQQCDIVGDTTLDHKNVRESSTTDRASTTLTMTCKLAGTVMLYLGTESAQADFALNPRRTLRTALTVNGTRAQNGVPVTVAANQATRVEIASNLTLYGPALGPFSASTVLMIAPP